MIQPFVISCLMFAALGFTLQAQEATQPIPSQTTSNVSVDPWQSIPLGLDPTSVIDLALEDGWRTNQIAPVAPADDPTFLRRIYLDLIGRIPRSDEVNAFVARTDSTKRVALIDSLLESEEHSDHFAEVLDAILIGRTDIDQLRRRTNAGWIAYLKRAIHDLGTKLLKRYYLQEVAPPKTAVPTGICTRATTSRRTSQKRFQRTSLGCESIAPNAMITRLLPK